MKSRVVIISVVVLLVALGIGGGTALGRSIGTSQTLLNSSLSVNLTSDPNNPIAFQGILRNSDGSAVSDGVHDVTFRIYDAVQVGNLLWEEAQQINTSNGLFSTLLGVNTEIAPTKRHVVRIKTTRLTIIYVLN